LSSLHQPCELDDAYRSDSTDEKVGTRALDLDRRVCNAVFGELRYSCADDIGFRGYHCARYD
jgi:hypothetical protein